MTDPQSNKELIAAAIVERLQLVTDFGAPAPFALIETEKLRVNLSDFQDFEIPGVQLIDVSTIEAPERHRGNLIWSLALQIVLREKEGFACTQKTLWLYEQATKEAIMAKPDLGLIGARKLPYNAAIKHILPTDRAADMTTMAPLHVAILGFQVLYYEPMTRRTN